MIAVAMSGGVDSSATAFLLKERGEEIVETAPTAVRGYHEAVTEAKRGIIREALEQTTGHQTKAAELLGLTQPYLARLMKNLGLRAP